MVKNYYQEKRDLLQCSLDDEEATLESCAKNVKILKDVEPVKRFLSTALGIAYLSTADEYAEELRRFLSIYPSTIW